MSLSGQKASEEKALAEAKAVSAEAAEQELRASVEAIKSDFEARHTCSEVFAMFARYGRVRTQEKSINGMIHLSSRED